MTEETAASDAAEDLTDTEPRQPHAWSRTLVAALILHVCSGACYTLAVAWQNRLVLPTGAVDPITGQAVRESFFHPLVQSALLVAGQALNVVPYAVSCCCSALRYSRGRTGGARLREERSGSDADVIYNAEPHRPLAEQSESPWSTSIVLALAMVAVLDCSQLALSIFALQMLDPSVFAMMRMTQLIAAALLQSRGYECMLSILNRRAFAPPAADETNRSAVDCAESSAAATLRSMQVRFHAGHAAGLAMLFLGALIVYDASRRETRGGISGTTAADASDGDRAAVARNGCLLVVAAVFLLALQASVQEFTLLLHRRVLSAHTFVGLQGCLSTAIMTVVLCLGSQGVLPPPLRDNVSTWAAQVLSSWEAASAVVVMVGFTATLDATGAFLTRAMTANLRPAFHPVRSAIVWVVGWTVHLSSFSWERLGGFAICTFGALVFKELVVLSVFRLSHDALEPHSDAHDDVEMHGDEVAAS